MSSASDSHDEMLELEQSCLNPEVRASPDRLSSLIADEFVEFGSSGRVWDKAAVVDEVPAQSGLVLTLSDFVAVRLASDLVHTTCRVSISEAGSIRHSLRNSLWTSHSGRWQMLFHQGTPCDAPLAR